MKAADVKSGGSEFKLLKYSENLRGLPGILANQKKFLWRHSSPGVLATCCTSQLNVIVMCPVCPV